MKLDHLGINSQAANSAYGNALLFDRMKKKGESASVDVASKDEPPKTDIQTLDDFPVKEKPKPNTIPFKPGFAFEYGKSGDKGLVTVTITETEKIKVEISDPENAETRRKTINGIVMLAVGKLNRESFNALLEQERLAPVDIKSELALMGVKSDIPFGLGENTFYFNATEKLAAYRPVDVKG